MIGAVWHAPSSLAFARLAFAFVPSSLAFARPALSFEPRLFLASSSTRLASPILLASIAFKASRRLNHNGHERHGQLYLVGFDGHGLRLGACVQDLDDVELVCGLRCGCGGWRKLTESRNTIDACFISEQWHIRSKGEWTWASMNVDVCLCECGRVPLRM